MTHRGDLSQTLIPLSALLAMPQGRILRVEQAQDMDGAWHTAVVLAWTWRAGEIVDRASFFDAQTGEYLGEADA